MGVVRRNWTLWFCLPLRICFLSGMSECVPLSSFIPTADYQKQKWNQELPDLLEDGESKLRRLPRVLISFPSRSNHSKTLADRTSAAFLSSWSMSHTPNKSVRNLNVSSWKESGQNWHLTHKEDKWKELYHNYRRHLHKRRHFHHRKKSSHLNEMKTTLNKPIVGMEGGSLPGMAGLNYTFSVPLLENKKLDIVDINIEVPSKSNVQKKYENTPNLNRQSFHSDLFKGRNMRKTHNSESYFNAGNDNRLNRMYKPLVYTNSSSKLINNTSARDKIRENEYFRNYSIKGKTPPSIMAIKEYIIPKDMARNATSFKSLHNNSFSDDGGFPNANPSGASKINHSRRLPSPLTNEQLEFISKMDEKGSKSANFFSEVRFGKTDLGSQGSPETSLGTSGNQRSPKTSFDGFGAQRSSEASFTDSSHHKWTNYTNGTAIENSTKVSFMNTANKIFKNSPHNYTRYKYKDLDNDWNSVDTPPSGDLKRDSLRLTSLKEPLFMSRLRQEESHYRESDDHRCYTVSDLLTVIIMTSLVNLFAGLIVTIAFCCIPFRGCCVPSSGRLRKSSQQGHSALNQNYVDDDTSVSVGCLEACLPDISYQLHVARDCSEGRVKKTATGALHRLAATAEEVSRTSWKQRLRRARDKKLIPRRSLSLEDLSVT